MAKFDEYPAKATPEDADTLMLYDAATKSNKLSPFSGIWNWIVNKLTNAVISNLQTNDKTVLGAINELNSNPNLMNLDNNIENFINASQKPRAYFVWGTIGGLFGGWAWGILMCSGSIRVANFIGINNASNSIAAATYKEKTWTKISISE